MVTFRSYLRYVLTPTNFSVGGQFYEHTDGVAMGSTLSPVITNFFMEDFGERALAHATHKPLCWPAMLMTHLSSGCTEQRSWRGYVITRLTFTGIYNSPCRQRDIATHQLSISTYTGDQGAPWAIRSTENLPTLTSIWTLDHNIPPTYKLFF